MPLAGFSEPTRNWFEATFAAPTLAQRHGWKAISKGGDTLILAPTGSGKTLAAFLWTLDRLLCRLPGAGGDTATTVLYVSPLKALAYDVERNLRAPLTGIALAAGRDGGTVAPVSVGIRTGDTPQDERRNLARHPPDILVTTPESLYLLLTSAARSTLTGVEHVIVDEVHALAGSKRGAHLALSLERLDRLVALSGRPRPQRIGLSATQRPLGELARWLGGVEPAALDPPWPGTGEQTATVAPGDISGGQARRSRLAPPASPLWRPRPVAVVDAGAPPALDLQVVVPVDDMREPGALPGLPGSGAIGRASPHDAHDAHDAPAGPSIWPAIDLALLDLIRSHRCTLVFVNSRRLAERLASRINDLAGEELVRAHHGSIAREQRLEIEDALKAGRLPALVATSSLELGIDMGAVDLVIQVEAPSSVASGIQRVGRAGHSVGEASRGRIFPKFRHDLVVAAVCAQRMLTGQIEETRIPRNPLDVVAQQIVAMVAGEGAGEESLTVEDVAKVVRGAYCFAGLSRDALEGVLDMLSGRYPSDQFAELRPRLNWDRLTGSLTPRPGARMLAVLSGGTIPDRGMFAVFTPEGGRVGELDEEMVYECRPGEAFVLGASTWRIVDITRDRVVVVPAPGEPGKTPFWHGDQVGRPFELGLAVGRFLAEAEGYDDDRLALAHALDQRARANLRGYLADQREATGGVLPTDRQLVVERFRDELGDWRVCVLSPLGARVHAPWAMAIEARIRDRLGLEAQAIWSDDGIVVRFPEADEVPPVDSILLDPDEVEELVVAEVGRSALFAARFREAAARALLLPRRRPGSRTPLWQLRQRAADLLAVASEHGSFPILLETYRECLSDHFDLPALVSLMGDIAARRVRVVSVDTALPSPFASSLAFSYVSNFIYEGDSPLAERRSAALTLDRALLAELVGSDELRSLVDPDALAGLEAELACLDERRWARSPDEAHDLLLRLGDLTPEELVDRCVPGLFGEMEPGGARRYLPLTTMVPRAALAVRVAGEERLIAPEDAGRYRDGLGVQPPLGVPDAFLVAVPDALTQLVRRWARTHGPFTGGEPAARLGVAEGLVEAVLVELERSGTVMRGQFRPGGRGLEWCDAGVLTTLRQRSLAAARREVAPTAVEALGRFLPVWQGVTLGGDPPPGWAAAGAPAAPGWAAAGAPAAPGWGSRAGPGALDRCWEVLGQLQGVVVPASVVEREVLAARVPGYSPQLLDELLAAGQVMWVGAGALGRDDGKVRLFQRDSAALLLARLHPGGRPPGIERPAGEEHERLRGLLGARRACFFRDLTLPTAVARPGDDAATLDALWDLVWAGEVTNDSFAPLRAATAGPRRGSGGRARAGPARRPRLGSLSASGPPTAQGRWSLVGEDLGPADTGGDRAGRARVTEASAALVAVLLERHGVLTREAVRAEGVPGGFASVYPVLRAMEEAGRVRRGYFVAGQGGAQFALPGAVDRLRDVRDGWSGVYRGRGGAAPCGGTAPGQTTLVLASTDPANVHGAALPWPVRGPQRVAGTWVVLVDGLASLYVERAGRGLVAMRAWSEPGERGWEAPAVAALDQLLIPGRLHRLFAERVEPALEPYLAAAGWLAGPRGLTRYAAAAAGTQTRRRRDSWT